MHFSHAAYKSWAHDPAAGRPPDMMVGSNKTSLPAGDPTKLWQHRVLRHTHRFGKEGEGERATERHSETKGLLSLLLRRNKRERKRQHTDSSASLGGKVWIRLMPMCTREQCVHRSTSRPFSRCSAELRHGLRRAHGPPTTFGRCVAGCTSYTVRCTSFHS